MKVTLTTKTVSSPISVEVHANEVYTHVNHFDHAIKTLRAAKAWFVAQTPKEDKKK